MLIRSKTKPLLYYTKILEFYDKFILETLEDIF